jgi:hypothetical protein
VVTLGDPPADSITVEDVTFEGSEPYTAAGVLVCDATNLGRITPAENSPVSSVIVYSDPQLMALRYSMHVLKTDGGWVRDSVRPATIDQGYSGQATCGS